MSVQAKTETLKKILEELLKLDDPQLIAVEGVLIGMDLERNIKRSGNVS